MIWFALLFNSFAHKNKETKTKVTKNKETKGEKTKRQKQKTWKKYKETKTLINKRCEDTKV